VGLIHWDQDFQDLQIMNVRVMIAGFPELVHGVIKSAGELLDDRLLFGMNRPSIHLKSLRDAMTKDERGFSVLKEPLNHLGDGYRLMLSLMKLATPDKRLQKDDDEEWDRKKVLEYLDKKR